MKTRLLLSLVTLLLVSGAAFAHGDKKHVVGTVEKINNNSIVLKTGDGKSIEVKLVAATLYIERKGQQDKASSLADLAVGNPVVVHATTKGDMLEADEIKFSKPYTFTHSHPAPAAKPQP